MVSLREQELKLIALRGAFACGGKPLRELPLAGGQRVQLAQGVFLDVDEVVLPEAVLGIEGPGVPRQVLAPVCSIVGGSAPRLVAGWSKQAAARVWSTGEEWRIQSEGNPVRSLGPGDRISVGSHELLALAIPLASACLPATSPLGGINAPLRIVANYDTVHLHRDGTTVATLSGILARLVSELVVLDGPIAWLGLARSLWCGKEDPGVLRQRLDVNLSRLRRRLGTAGIRTDLVRTDGAGCVELLLKAGDRVEDRT